MWIHNSVWCTVQGGKEKWQSWKKRKFCFSVDSRLCCVFKCPLHPTSTLVEGKRGWFWKVCCNVAHSVLRSPPPRPAPSSYLHCEWATEQQLEKDKRIQQKLKRFKIKQAQRALFFADVSPRSVGVRVCGCACTCVCVRLVARWIFMWKRSVCSLKCVNNFCWIVCVFVCVQQTFFLSIVRVWEDALNMCQHVRTSACICF